MPGSPPKSISEPLTIPPPTTLSNSDMPEGVRSYVVNSTCDRGFAWGEEKVAFLAAGAGGATISSAMVLNFPHDGHLPSQRGLVAPHSEQTKTVFVLAIYMYRLKQLPRQRGN